MVVSVKWQDSICARAAAFLAAHAESAKNMDMHVLGQNPITTKSGPEQFISIEEIHRPLSTGVGGARVALFDSSRMCWTILAPSQRSLASDSYVSIPVKGFFQEISPGTFQSLNGGSKG